MKVTVHRGSHEIGGNCIEVSSGKTTILLDVGLPLSRERPQVDVSQLSVDAALISHPHQDHFGLMELLRPETPVYLGKLSKDFIQATRVFLGKKNVDRDFRHFNAWEQFALGDFKITPYLVDHSAADAYAFLIEAEGKRLFYSGDLRAHGRKGVLFKRLLERPFPNLDVMFLEGTMVRRNNDLFPDERAVEDAIFEVIRRQKNISFILSSSQNIDRVVSAYRACKRAGKILVLDIYTAWVLEQVQQISRSVPCMERPEIRVYGDRSQDETLKANADYFGDFRRRLYRHRVKLEELHARPAAFLYFGKMSSFTKIDRFKKPETPVNVIYSQWQGYLDGSHQSYYGSDKISAYREDPRVSFVYAHTSGHAPLKDLKKLAVALKPKMLVPIHTEDAEGFRSNFENVRTLKDGEQFVLN